MFIQILTWLFIDNNYNLQMCIYNAQQYMANTKELRGNNNVSGKIM